MSGVPVPEDTPAIQRAERANHRWVQTAVAASILTLIVSLALTWFRFADSAKQSTTQHAVVASIHSAARADCRTAYNSDRAAIIEQAQALGRQASADGISYLLGKGSVEILQQDSTALNAANKAATNLPPLNMMVDNGYTLHGVSHPACPVVK